MIALSPVTALMLYLFAALGVLLMIWARDHYFSRKRKIQLDDKQLQVCEYCHFVYLYSVGKEISQCPQCCSYNKKG